MEQFVEICLIILTPLLIMSGIVWLVDTFPSLNKWFIDKANRWF